VFIPFPYADLSSSKKRPVLALTAPDRHGDFIALAVTSVEQFESAVQLTQDALALGSLPRTSWIRLDKVFTLSTGNIVRTFGRVTEAVLRQSMAGLCATVGYAKTSGVPRSGS
jgi:mRNA interferase MazF